MLSFLFGVSPADPLAFGAAIAVFLAAALIAAGLPARRAANLDPIAALRRD
jgi:ABC-type antimicrobial peptide transport system permease subunit